MTLACTVLFTLTFECPAHPSTTTVPIAAFCCIIVCGFTLSRVSITGSICCRHRPHLQRRRHHRHRVVAIVLVIIVVVVIVSSSSCCRHVVVVIVHVIVVVVVMLPPLCRCYHVVHIIVVVVMSSSLCRLYATYQIQQPTHQRP